MTVRLRLTVNGAYADGDGVVGLSAFADDGTAIFARAEVASWDPSWESTPSAEAALRAIVHKVKTAPNSFEAAGEWLTRITNEITKAIREEDKR